MVPDGQPPRCTSPVGSVKIHTVGGTGTNDTFSDNGGRGGSPEHAAAAAAG